MGASMNGDYGDLNTAIKEAFRSYSKDEETKRLQSQKDEALAQVKEAISTKGFRA